MTTQPTERKTTTRGLIETDLGPLRRFTGVLDSITDLVRTFGEGDNARESLSKQFNCKDIEIKEAVEPYHYPIYTVTIPLSNRKKSRWGVMSEGVPEDRTVGFNNVADLQYSAEQLDPDNPNFVKPVDRLDIEACIGKRIGWVLTDGQDGRPKPADLYDGRANGGQGGDVPTPAWVVYELEGVGTAGAGAGTSALDLAVALLDGKTLADFNKAALDNSAIRADVSLLQSIGMPPSAPNSFANTMTSTGKFTVDEQGVYHKA